VLSVPTSTEISARLKAARWLIGATSDKPAPLSVESLAKHPLLVKNRITKNRIEEIEQAKAKARSMELEKIADALGLPHAWFTAEDWRPLIHEPPAESSKWRTLFRSMQSKPERELEELFAEMQRNLDRMTKALREAATAPPADEDAEDGPPHPDPDHLPDDQDEDVDEAQGGRS